MRTLSKIGLFLFGLFILSGCHTGDSRNSAAFRNREKTWLEFRSKLPYNIQVIGIEQFKEDNSSNVIISEPPETLDTAKLLDLINDRRGSYEIKTNPIGLDGWVKDIVISFANLND